MATLVGSLFTSLTLESSSFVSNMKRAADSAERGTKLIEKGFTAAKTAAVGFLSVQTAQQFLAVGQRALDYAASIGEVSQQLGITAKDYQTYSYAATQAGVAQSELETGLGKFTQTIGKAKTGNEQALVTFKALGLSLDDLKNKANGDILRSVADGLARIPDPAQRAAVEVALFGRAGQKLDTLLSGGTAAIDELSSAAERAGIVLSDEMIARADEAADKLAAVKFVLEAKIASVVSENADSILKLADALSGLASAAASIRPDQWKLILGGAAAGAAAGFVSPIPGGTILGAIAGGGAVAWSAADANAQRRAVMPGTPAGMRFDPKTGKFVGGGKPNIGPTITDIDLSPTRVSAKKIREAKAELDPFIESLKRMDALEIELYRPDARSDDPLLNGQLQANLDGLAATVTRIDEQGAFELAKLGEAADKRAEDFERMRNFADQAAASITSGFEDAIFAGKGLDDIFKGLIEDIAKLTIRQAILQPISNAIAGGLNGKGFGGFFANGGMLGAGKWGIAGEAGPEIIKGPAQIIPNGAMKGMGVMRQAVAVRVEPSPLFITTVAQASSAAGQSAAGETFRQRTRPTMLGGLG